MVVVPQSMMAVAVTVVVERSQLVVAPALKRVPVFLLFHSPKHLLVAHCSVYVQLSSVEVDFSSIYCNKLIDQDGKMY